MQIVPPNIVMVCHGDSDCFPYRLHEVFFHEGDIHVVYEFFDGDLEMIIRKQSNPSHYTPADIKVQFCD